jgi:hypothetical protein
MRVEARLWHREEQYLAMILVTTLVTVGTHKNTHYPAKRRKEAHKRAT